MTWGRPRKGGWGGGQEEDTVSRVSQVIRTIISVVPGGVIRYAKEGPDDDTHVGFWLGVTSAGVARFTIGGPAGWLKWTGSELLVRGMLSTIASSAAADRLRWVGQDGQDVAYAAGLDSWGHHLEFGVPRTDAAGDPGRLDFFVDGDIGAAVRLAMWTERGAGRAGSKLILQIGTGRDVWTVEGDGNVWARGVVACADPVEEGHAVTRRAGDSRYVSKAAGWSGSFATGAGQTVTVVDGQITAVA